MIGQVIGGQEEGEEAIESIKRTSVVESWSYKKWNYTTVSRKKEKLKH